MSRKKQLTHTEDIRARIMAIAKDIIVNDGVDKLSVRRITNRMGYTAGIIYHYFANMDDLVAHVLLDEYKQIVANIVPIADDMPPDLAMRASIKAYIDYALEDVKSYKALMLCENETVLGYTSVLGDMDASKRAAITRLSQTIEMGVVQGYFAPCDARVTAQAVWSAMFGLTIRLAIEKGVSHNQRDVLIEREIDIMIKGLEK